MKRCIMGYMKFPPLLWTALKSTEPNHTAGIFLAYVAGACLEVFGRKKEKARSISSIRRKKPQRRMTSLRSKRFQSSCAKVRAEAKKKKGGRGRGRGEERVSMGWWLLRLSAKIFAFLRLSVHFFQLRLTKKLKINFFCFKKLNIN